MRTSLTAFQCCIAGIEQSLRGASSVRFSDAAPKKDRSWRGTLVAFPFRGRWREAPDEVSPFFPGGHYVCLRALPEAR